VKNKVIEINSEYPDRLVLNIIKLIKDEKIIIMPSDTVYGFLSLPSQESRLREIKKRDKKPFLFLISNFSQLNKINVNTKTNKLILEKYWPGPITFILNQKNNNSIGIRMPDWYLLQKIIDGVGLPLISTSVNYSGMPVLNNIKDIINEFSEKVDLIIFDKSFKQDISSTIVNLTKKPYKILRKGSVLFEID